MSNKTMKLKGKLAGCAVISFLNIAHLCLLLVIVSLAEQSFSKAFHSLKTYGIILLALNVLGVILSLCDKSSEKATRSNSSDNAESSADDVNIDISTELMILSDLDINGD